MDDASDDVRNIGKISISEGEGGFSIIKGRLRIWFFYLKKEEKKNRK